MRYFLLATSCIPFFFLLACQSKIDYKLSEAETLMEQMPDSSLAILQNLQERYPEMSEEGKALFGLLYFRASIKKASGLPPQEIIDLSINYYSTHNQRQQLAYSYFCKARIFKERREYGDAIKNLLKAKELCNREKDFSLLGKIYFDLGQIAGYQGENKKAMDYFNQAVNNFDKAGDRESVSKVFLVIGWNYMAVEEFDEAIRFSRKALENTTDSIIMGDVLNDIGNSYYFKEEFDSALYYMRQSLHYPYFDTNMSSRYYNIGNVFSYRNKYDSALVYINKAFEYPIDIYFEEECYRVLMRIALAKNDKENFTLYMAQRENCRDSIKKLELQPNIGLLEQIHQSDLKTVEVKNQRLYLIIILLFFILAGCLVVTWLYKHNKRKQHKVEFYEKEHAAARESYSETKRKADSYKAELMKKHELVLSELNKKLEESKAKYAVERKKATAEQQEEIDKAIYNEVLCFSSETVFINKMDRILNNLPEKLQKDYPEITYKEIVWCCLFVLEFPTHIISLILDFKQSTQYKFKQRLSKKLNFNSVKDLEQMLHEKANF